MPKKFISIGAKIRSQTSAGLGKLSRSLVSASGHQVGHRGIAAGSLPGRQQLRDQGLAPYTPEEIARWQTITKGGVEHFVYQGGIFVVNSSNVSSARYLHAEQKMIVVFKGGKAYEYSNISETEAKSFAFAKSKGSWVWSYLRVRGSKTAHRKPYRALFFVSSIDYPRTILPSAPEVQPAGANSLTHYDDFTLAGHPLFINAGNLMAARYDRRELELYVLLRNGDMVKYVEFTMTQALAFARANDKEATLPWQQQRATARGL